MAWVGSPSSPSWRLLETRSTSFPHTRPAGDPAVPVRPWASRFTHNFPTTKTTTTGLPLYSFSPNNSPSPSRLRKQPPSRRTTPVLTLALLKLDENLGKFCELLEDPTYDHVQKACAILDSTVATANAGNQSTNNQNGRDDFPPSNTPPNAESPRTSPSISPIASWLIGGPYHQAAEMSPTSSAVALEGEFEKFCSPLIVFASSEGIYSSLGHAESSDLARNLTRLYERIAVDIQLVRETLCDPFLPNTEIASPPFLNPLHNSSKNHNINNTKKNSALPGKSSKLLAYKEIAARLATSLDIIRNICICRCKLIEQQKILWSSPDFIDTAEAASFIAQTILPLLQMPKYDVTSDTSAASVQVHAARLFKNLAQEAEAWFYLMEMTRSIEQARFMASIVNSQKMKLRLHKTSKTCVHLWLFTLWQCLLSILPVVFDKVQSGTKSLYGFDKSSFDVPSINRIGPSKDLNAKIEEFLRLEEKMGAHFSVSVIFDATMQGTVSRGFSVDSFERGFTVRDEAISKVSAAVSFESQNLFASFPSLYMRGSVQMTSPAPTTMMRKNGSTNDKGSNEILREEKQESAPSQKPEMVSWPYASWARLIPLLSQERSRRLTEEHWEWLQTEATFFHGTPINNNMWFVVMVQSTDDGKWNRRRSSTLLEEEVQHFLNEVLSCLQFTEIFSRAGCLEIRRNAVESGSSFSTEAGGKMLGGGHGDFVDLLQSIKEELGLRSLRTREALSASYGLRLMSSRFGKSPGNVNRRGAGSQPSHHAFFLGSQLMNAI